MKTRKAFPLLLSMLIMTSGCLHTETSSQGFAEPERVLSIDPQILNTASVPWNALSDYVAMNIPFAPVAALKQTIESREKVDLKSRGEAHITVVTPQELVVLRSRLSLEQINGLIDKAALQKKPIQLQCLGRGRFTQGHGQLLTYFIVVDAPGLLQVREKLRQIFVAAGGEKEVFAAELFYPHITVGYTDRDLHFSDGVVKDKKSCIYALK